MNEGKMRPEPQANLEQPDEDAPRKRRPTAAVAIAITCLCVALAVQFGSGLFASDPRADTGPYTDCDTDLSDELDELNVPGLSAVIVKDGKIACAAIAGLADRRRKRPVTPDTLFLVASVSKTVTVTALMQLFEHGEFGLDDDINDYLPFQVTIPEAPSSEITFRQLLTHTAALDDATDTINKLVSYGKDSPISLATLTEEYFTPDGDYYDRDANFRSSVPGEELHYANMGFVLIGYLVEEISGQPFDEYCRDNIFDPLDMPKTSWRLEDIDETELAVPYEPRWPNFNSLAHYGQANYPDGMLRTSTVELAHFLIAYMEGGAYDGESILKRGTLREILSRQTRHNAIQGLGWFKASVDDRIVWGHDGSDDGASAGMWFDPSESAGVIMVANGVWENEAQLFERLFEESDDY